MDIIETLTEEEAFEAKFVLKQAILLLSLLVLSAQVTVLAGFGAITSLKAIFEIESSDTIFALAIASAVVVLFLSMIISSKIFEKPLKKHSALKEKLYTSKKVEWFNEHGFEVSEEDLGKIGFSLPKKENFNGILGFARLKSVKAGMYEEVKLEYHTNSGFRLSAMSEVE